MDYINKKHIGIVQSINFIMKFPKKQIAFLEEIKSKQKQQPNDYELLLSYSFLKYFEITRLVQGEDLANTDILKVIEIYNAILDIKHDDWFVRMLKILLYSKLPQTMRNEEDIESTIEWMLDIQKSSPSNKCFFILPYIYYAEHYFGKKDVATAKIYLERGLNETTDRRPIKILCLNPHIFYPIKDLYYRLYKSQEYDLANYLRQICCIYFPEDSINFKSS